MRIDLIEFVCFYGLRVFRSTFEIDKLSIMSTKETKNTKKISVLQKIRDSKEILFGAFSPNLTKQTKVEEWKKIHSFALSIGVISPEKDFVYLRDTYWPNIKRTTTAKVDNARSTGKAGGKKYIYNDVDNLVLDIVGRDSTILQGIGVSSSMPEYALPTQDLNTNSNDAMNLRATTSEDNAGTDGAGVEEQFSNGNKKNKKKRIRPAAENSELRILKKQIMEAQLQYLKEKTINVLLEREKIQREIEIYDRNNSIIVEDNFDEKNVFIAE